MWPVCLLVSATLHATVLLSIGVKSGSTASMSAKTFSVVDIATPNTAVAPQEYVALHVKATPDAAVAGPKAIPKRESDTPGAIQSAEKELSLEQRNPPFYKSSEVSHIAQLQLPLEGVLFSDELSLSGRLVLDIAVSDVGKVLNIEVIEASDVSGALRAHILPMLSGAPFTPAYKGGIAVNSIRRVEFTLGMVIDDPNLGFKSSVSPGFRPRMDERGNILKDQPKQSGR